MTRAGEFNVYNSCAHATCIELTKILVKKVIFSLFAKSPSAVLLPQVEVLG